MKNNLQVVGLNILFIKNCLLWVAAQIPPACPTPNTTTVGDCHSWETTTQAVCESKGCLWCAAASPQCYFKGEFTELHHWWETLIEQANNTFMYTDYRCSISCPKRSLQWSTPIVITSGCNNKLPNNWRANWRQWIWNVLPHHNHTTSYHHNHHHRVTVIINWLISLNTSHIFTMYPCCHSAS